MLLLSRRHMLVGPWTVLALVLLAGHGLGQEAKDGKEPAKFDSVDGVKIRGHFYASVKKTQPVVMILHGLEEKSTLKGYTELAETLQKKDYNVLTFDFRGHGQSKEVDPAEFWAKNRTYFKAGSQKNPEIDIKDMTKQYYPTLVNDIAAAKAYLDRKNDKGECNSSSLIIVGAGTGATLGAIWLNSEFYRFKYVPNAMGFGGKLESKPEGLGVIGAVWLSIAPDLGGRAIKLSSLLDMPANQRAVPMVFMFSDGDSKGKELAKKIDEKIGTWAKGKRTDKAGKYQFTGTVPIERAGKLNGSSLLQSSLGTAADIADYLGKVVDVKGNEYIEKDFRRSQYVWLNPTNPNTLNSKTWTPAKPMDKMTLSWNTYELFLPR